MKEKTYTESDVNKLVASALEAAALTANSDMDNSFRQRIMQIRSGGYDFADTLHDIYMDYGYPAELDFYNFWNMYRRFGVAKRIVNIYPDMGWKDLPMLGNDALQKEIDGLPKKLNFWNRLKAADKRQRVGRYSALFLRVRDGKKPEQPIVGKLNGVASLMEIMPLYESQIDPVEVDDNPMSETYGLPIMYQYRSDVGNRNPDVADTFNIHPSRLIILSEEADDGGIYGFSQLEAPYNSLMDLRKILGAGGEGFYKNAAQSIVFELQDASSAKANKELLDGFNENYDDFAKNRARRAMWSPNMKPHVLDSSLSEPKSFAEAVLFDIAAACDVPITILIGQLTGKLASDQDIKTLLSRTQSRRVNWQTVMLSAVIDKFIEIGIFKAGSYEIEWPDAMAASDDEKLELAVKMADINHKQFTAGGEIPFAGNEIRNVAGYEDEDLELPSEELDEEG